MATDWFSNSVRKDTIMPNLDKLDTGELSLDQWNISYGDVPLYHTEEDGFRANYRANMDQMKDWLKDNKDKIEYTTDFDIKADAITEFNTLFPPGKIVQIPSNAKGGNLSNDQVISYTNLSKDAGITQTKFYMALLLGKIFNEERVVTRADGTRDWKPGVTREQKLEYNHVADMKDAFKVLFNTQRSIIDRAQEPQNASQETALLNSRVTEVAGEGSKNITQDEMLGDVQMSALWDTYPAVKPDVVTSAVEQEDKVESNADTEENTNETFVDEQGNDTNVDTMTMQGDKEILAVLNSPEYAATGKLPDIQGSFVEGDGTATIQQETDVAQNLRNLDYFMKPAGQPRPNILHAFSSYNTNFEFFMMTPYDYNEVVEMLAGTQYNTSVYNDFENKPGRRLFGSSGVKTTNTAESSSNNPNFTKEYHIERVELQSYVSPSKNNGGTKFTNGTMTIFEPYGATLLENIVKASVDGSIEPPTPNYLQIPYMLKVSFKGYDEQGNPMNTNFLTPQGSESASTSFTQDPGTKYMTIKISNFSYAITPEGSEYTIEFYNFDADTLQNYYGTLPNAIQINEGTLGNFFGITEPLKDNQTITTVENAAIETRTRAVGPGGAFEEEYQVPTFKSGSTAKSLPQILNKWEEEKVSSGAQEYADKFSFRYDAGAFPNEEFLTCQLARPEKVGDYRVPVVTDKIKAITQNTNQTAGFSTAPGEAGNIGYQFPRGASILSVIHSAIATSTFMTNQVQVNRTNITNDIDRGLRQAKYGANADTVEIYRDDYSLSGTKTGLLLMYKITPRVKMGKYDYKRKTYQKEIIWTISIYNREGEQATNVKKSPVDNIAKMYDYLYTGKNKDVLNFDIQINTGYFSTKIIGSYADQMSANRDNDGESRPITPGGPGEADSYIGSKTPVRIVSGNDSTLAQGNSSDPATLIATDLMSRIYEGGADLLSAELEIMGDPQFIIQDEAFGSDAHSDHFSPNGSVSTHRDPIIQINIFTPSDIASDGTISPTSKATRAVGPGGAFREDYTVVNKGVSVFSGRYRVLTIQSTFDGNTFTQTLNLVKITDEDKDHVITSSQEASNTVLYSTFTDEIGRGVTP